MKKLLYSVIILLFVTPCAFAVDVEFAGQHRARGIYYQQDDIADIFIQRFKFSGAFRSNEMFESHFWIMTNYKWGDTDYSDNDIRIYGYGDWKVSDELKIRLGRSPSYQIDYGTSVGANDYEKYPYVMDGAFVTYNTESLAVDLWGVYLPGTWVGQKEIKTYNNAVGISLNARSLPEEFEMANLFGVYAAGENDATHIRLGVSIGGDISGLDYKLVGVIHGDEFGANIVEQHAVDAQLGYTLDFDARIYIGGHYESDKYDPFYYDRHSRSGLLDVAQWGNGTVYGKGGIAYMPSEDFEVGILGLYFHSIGSWGMWGNDGNNPGDSSLLSKEQVIEADIYVKKRYAGGFAIEVHGGLFDLNNETPYWQVQLNTSFDF